MIKPWIFEFFVAPGPPGVDVTPQAANEHYKWYLELWQKADWLLSQSVVYESYLPGPH
jgi:hypothetical protein